MNVALMFLELVGTFEGISIPAIATKNIARKLAREMAVHVAFHFKVSVEPVRGIADTTLQDLSILAALGDRCNCRADDDFLLYDDDILGGNIEVSVSLETS